MCFQHIEKPSLSQCVTSRSLENPLFVGPITNSSFRLYYFNIFMSSCAMQTFDKIFQADLHRRIPPLTLHPLSVSFINHVHPLPSHSQPKLISSPSFFKFNSMAIDLVRFSKIDDRTAMEEAASAGLQSMEHLIRVLSNQTPSHTNLDCREITDFTVGKFKQFISVLNRTGHARFRRGPANPSTSSSPPPPPPANPVPPKPQPNLSFESGNPNPNYSNSNSKDCFTLSPPMSTTSSFISSITTGDGSVSNGKVFSSAAVPPAPAFSAGKPPLSQSHRKRCHDELAAKTTSSDRCHCSKRRYLV